MAWRPGEWRRRGAAGMRFLAGPHALDFVAPKAARIRSVQWFHRRFSKMDARAELGHDAWKTSAVVVTMRSSDSAVALLRDD